MIEQRIVSIQDTEQDGIPLVRISTQALTICVDCRKEQRPCLGEIVIPHYLDNSRNVIVGLTIGGRYHNQTAPLTTKENHNDDDDIIEDARKFLANSKWRNPSTIAYFTIDREKHYGKKNWKKALDEVRNSRNEQ